MRSGIITHQLTFCGNQRSFSVMPVLWKRSDQGLLQKVACVESKEAIRLS